MIFKVLNGIFMTRSKDRKLQDRAARREKRKHLSTPVESEPKKKPKEDSSLKCPKCKSPLYVIEGNRRSVFVCTSCEYRASAHGKAV